MTSQSPSPASFAVDSHPSRKRSVQFTSSPSPSAHNRVPTADSQSSSVDHDNTGIATTHQTGESSADEITPIISHPRQHKSTSSRYDGGDSKAPPHTCSATSGPYNSRKRVSRSSKRSSSSRDKADPPSSSGSNNATSNRINNAGQSAEEDDDDAQTSTLTTYLRSTAEKYGTLTLENKGSVARDHLALERTFLAWLRTSLAFASIGIAITQLFRLNTTIKSGEGYTPVGSQPSSSFSPLLPNGNGSGNGTGSSNSSNNDSTNGPGAAHQHLRQMGKPLGATFLGIAMVVLIVGARRYFEAQYWIVRGMFPASRGSVLLITAIAAALIVASLVVVVVVEPSVFERK